MKMKTIATTLLFSLMLALPAFASASPQTIKQDMQQAGTSTKNATVKTGRKVKRGSKKVVHKSAKKTRHGAAAVEHKTQTPSQPQ